MSANNETTPSPVAKPATEERLRSECNDGVVLDEDVVVIDGERTLNCEDGLKVDRVGAKVLELENDVKFGWMIKPRLLSVLLIKPGG